MDEASSSYGRCRRHDFRAGNDARRPPRGQPRRRSAAFPMSRHRSSLRRSRSTTCSAIPSTAGEERRAWSASISAREGVARTSAGAVAGRRGTKAGRDRQTAGAAADLRTMNVTCLDLSRKTRSPPGVIVAGVGNGSVPFRRHILTRSLSGVAATTALASADQSFGLLTCFGANRRQYQLRALARTPIWSRAGTTSCALPGPGYWQPRTDSTLWAPAAGRNSARASIGSPIVGIASRKVGGINGSTRPATGDVTARTPTTVPTMVIGPDNGRR